MTQKTNNRFHNSIISVTLVAFVGLAVLSCNETGNQKRAASTTAYTPPEFDTTKVPRTPFGKAVLYGRELMMNTALYIGPNGVTGRFSGSLRKCGSCHQNGGIKPHSFSLVLSHQAYPQYRAREGKLLSLADRVNNCVTRAMNGKPLSYNSEEMLAFLAYFKYINDRWSADAQFRKKSAFVLQVTNEKASSERGAVLYATNCNRCHGNSGEGILNAQEDGYIYPPLWGSNSYQAGSGMHRVIKMAGWLKLNMPFDNAQGGKPFLTDQQALDLAAFINDDAIHQRPFPINKSDYPDIYTKPIDYTRGPYADSFSQDQHKFGPYPPIIKYLEKKQLKAYY